MRLYRVCMSTSPVAAPKILYHYTTSQGLIGIFNSGALWATDAGFLNDAQELQFGRRELCEALLDRAEELFQRINSPGPQSGYREGPGVGGEDYTRAVMIRSAVDYLSFKYDLADRGPVERLYLTCFCETGDLLSQWRGYGGDGGFALGLASDVLRDTEAELIQVQYGEAAKAPVIDRILAEIASEPRGHPNATGWLQGETIALPALASIKHDVFQEEREWRLVALGRRGADGAYRPGTYGVIPYIELEIDLGAAVREIVVGPGTHATLRALGARRLLDDNGLNAVVRPSEAPFQG